MTTGVSNVSVGQNTLSAATVTSNNTAIGTGALSGLDKGSGGSQYTSGNIGIGHNALVGGVPASGSFEYNIAIGNDALNSTGTSAGITGTIAIGASALTALTTGAGNTAIGHTALAAQSVGNFNTAIGYQALAQSTKTGTAGNTAVGYKAGYACVAAGYANTFIGINAGVSTTAGSNTIIGAEAGDILTTGIGNTIIGATADPSAAGGRYQIVIGNTAVGVANNSATIGDASITDVYMAQDSGAIVHSGALVNGLTAINLTGNTTLALDTHSVVRGRYVTVSATGIITLPTVVIGAVFIIVNIAADDSTLLTVSPQSGDKFAVDIACAVGTNGKDIILTEATHNQGDFVKLLGIAANVWAITEISGIWVDEA